jgi:hypothetical protein
MTIQIRAIECRTAREALDTARESGCGDAILLNGKPDTVTEAEVDTLIGEGLWQKCRLDRCDECGAYFPHAELVERHDTHGLECLCRTCGGENSDAPDQS